MRTNQGSAELCREGNSSERDDVKFPSTLGFRCGGRLSLNRTVFVTEELDQSRKVANEGLPVENREEHE